MKIELTDAQLEYLKNYIDDEIESAYIVIALADNKIDRKSAEADLLFFEEFKKALSLR